MSDPREEPQTPRGGRLQGLLARLLPAGSEGALVGRNSGWLLGDRVFRLLVGLLVNAWLVRYLGAEQLGLMSFAQSIVVITQVVSALGLETILVRDLVRQPQADDELLGTALRMRLLGWLGTLALAVTAVAVLQPGGRLALLLTLVFSVNALSQALDVVESWFQSRTRVTPVVAARLVAFVIAAAAKLVAIQLRAPLLAVAAILAAEFALSALALLVAYAREGRSPLRWRWNGARAAALLRDSWPLMLNGVAVVVSVRGDQMLITTLRGTAENGIYAAAQRLTEIVYYVPIAVMAAAGPVLLRSHARDAVEYARRLQRVFTLLGLAGLAIAVTVSLGAPLIVRLLFGEAFRATAPVLAIQVWSAPAFFLGIAQTNWFIAEGRQRGILVRSTVAAVASLALNVALVPPLGARGAAIAMVASQTLAHWLFNALFATTRPLFRMQCRALIPGRRP